ncbi:MAG: MFS transporter [Candidatus Binatia bacterium]
MSRTERTYYLVFGLYHASWSFLGPVYPLFLLSRGLDLFEINVVLAVYFVTVLVFEVPTGAVADRFGRRASFLASCLIRCAAFALYWRSSSFPAFLLAEFIDAIGTTLATGALDAWAIDGVRAEGRADRAERLFARGHAIARGTMIAAGLAGGYLASSDIGLPWIVGAASFLATAAIGSATMREHRGRTDATNHPSLVATMRESVALLRRSEALWTVCVLTAVTAFAHMPAMLLWPPRLEQIVGREMWLMGWVWVLLNAAAMLASATVSKVGAETRSGRLLAAVTALRALALGVAAGAVGPVVAVGGILFLEAGFAAADPFLQARMSDGATAEHRATVLSLRSMSFTSGGALGLVLLGFAARGFGIPVAWLGAAAVLMLAVPLFLRLDRPRSGGDRALEGLTPARMRDVGPIDLSGT